MAGFDARTQKGIEQESRPSSQASTRPGGNRRDELRKHLRRRQSTKSNTPDELVIFVPGSAPIVVSDVEKTVASDAGSTEAANTDGKRGRTKLALPDRPPRPSSTDPMMSPRERQTQFAMKRSKSIDDPPGPIVPPVSKPRFFAPTEKGTSSTQPQTPSKPTSKVATRMPIIDTREEAHEPYLQVPRRMVRRAPIVQQTPPPATPTALQKAKVVPPPVAEKPRPLSRASGTSQLPSGIPRGKENNAARPPKPVQSASVREKAHEPHSLQKLFAECKDSNWATRVKAYERLAPALIDALRDQLDADHAKSVGPILKTILSGLGDNHPRVLRATLECTERALQDDGAPLRMHLPLESWLPQCITSVQKHRTAELTKQAQKIWGSVRERYPVDVLITVLLETLHSPEAAIHANARVRGQTLAWLVEIAPEGKDFFSKSQSMTTDEF